MQPAVAPESVFEKHLAWSETVASNVWRNLPPSFDLDDLKQIARIEHWRRSQLYNPTGPHAGIPYPGYAYTAVYGAVMMACRRRHWKEATAEELSPIAICSKPSPEDALVHREEQRRSDRRERRRLQRVRDALRRLPAADAYLLRRVYLEGVDVEQLEAFVPGIKRRLARAITKLRRAVTPDSRKAARSAA